MKFTLIPAVALLLVLMLRLSRAAPESAGGGARPRLIALTSALIDGVHWGQVVLREEGGKGDSALFGLNGLTLQQAKDLNADLATLLGIPTDQIVEWSRGGTPARAKEIDQLIGRLIAHPVPDDAHLPVNVISAYMAKRLTGPEEFFVRAVANLGQLDLQLDKDGTQLQDLMKLYIALGMRQIYLPTDDAAQIADARTLAASSGAAPFGTDDGAYRYMLKKLGMWFVKSSGAQDRTTLGRDLLKDPDVKALLPALKALPPRRVAFLGHSLMLSLHWSTYGSWCDIAGEAMKQINPDFDYRDFQSGGLDARVAVRQHLAHILAYKPTDAYIEVFVATPEHRKALEKMVTDLTAAGSRVYLVNEVRPWTKVSPEIRDFYAQLATRPNVYVLDFYSLGQSAPGHETWAAIDNIHMQTPGHVFYAKETLKLWAAGIAQTAAPSGAAGR